LAQQVTKKVTIGAAFMVVGRLATRCISVVSTLFLVRLLVPEDFGLVALASAAVTLAETLTATGYAVVLVRRKDVEQSLFDTAWTMNLVRCLLLGGLIAATATWQARLLGDERLASVLHVIALSIALDGLMSVGLVRLQRDLRFDLLFRHQVAFRFTSFVVTVVLAWTTQSYFCLVLGNLIAKSVAIPLSYRLGPYRPRLTLRHWRELMSFSKWNFAQNLCVVADGQAASLVLGPLAGVQAVGAFNVSYQIAATPVTELAVPVRGPIYSGYARVAHDTLLLQRQYLDGLGLFLTILLPLSAGIALVAPEIERLALGAAWTGTAAITAVCALYVLADAVAHFTFNVFMVLDRQPRLVAVYATLVAIRLPLMIAAAVHAGPVGVVTVLLATGILNAVVWNWQAAQLLELRLADLWGQLWRTLSAAALMSLAVTVLRALLAVDAGGVLVDLFQMILLAGCGAVVHIGAQWLLWLLAGTPAGAEARIAAAALHVLRRLLRRHSATGEPTRVGACRQAGANGMSTY
jgi:O-antigen/teichoic acid export membrane protein